MLQSAKDFQTQKVEELKADEIIFCLNSLLRIWGEDTITSNLTDTKSS